MPNILMVIPANVYRDLPVALREKLFDAASLIAMGEKGVFRVDKSRDKSVPDHLTVDAIGAHLDPGDP